MRILSIMVVLLILAGCTAGSRVLIGKNSFDVEVASSPETRALGLMYRESLDENKGMLFIFEDESQRAFWMKNTKIPLDMIFINKEKKIVNILTAEPCDADPCQNYGSEKPAMYVLEINAGLAEKNNLKIGDSVKIYTQ